ncbi:MAG: YbaB/EbfC family nucleoid-associated protein [Nitrospinae bacterium]|nr:YbaB/EbfC family nucleoid-associated protein [Nitrospinota bacterium]
MSKGFGNLMRQVNSMQKKITAVQAELNEKTVEGEAGQGKVKVVATGGNVVKSVTITDKALVDPNDTGMLEDLIAVAVNDALTRARKMKDEELGKITAGLPVNLPGML